MKAKRKVHLSGKWWYPTREFEFYADKTFEDVVNLIQYTYLLEYDDMKRYKTESGKSEVYYEFLIHRTVSRGGMSAYIKSSVQQSEVSVKFHGKVGINKIFLYNITLFALLIMIVPFCIFLFQYRYIEASICLLCPINFIWFYIPHVRKRNDFFDDFLESVLMGKIKNEQDISELAN